MRYNLQTRVKKEKKKEKRVDDYNSKKTNLWKFLSSVCGRVLGIKYPLQRTLKTGMKISLHHSLQQPLNPRFTPLYTQPRPSQAKQL
jgi:hypothetical protein